MDPALASFVEKLTPERQLSELRADVVELARVTGHTEPSLLAALARVIAERFLDRQLTHSSAMAMAACLYDFAFPALRPTHMLYRVYWALDEAEYGLETDGPDEDAPELRSRVRVGEVLASGDHNDA